MWNVSAPSSHVRSIRGIQARPFPRRDRDSCLARGPSVFYDAVNDSDRREHGPFV